MACAAATNQPIKLSAPAVASDCMTTPEAAAYLKLSRQFLEGARYRGERPRLGLDV